MKRDGVLPSLWQYTSRTAARQPHRAANLADRAWDVLIVGGGITGLTTALRLQEAGLDCAVAEAHQIGFGTTGGTTAHINTMLDTPYHTIENDFGAANAQLVADAARAARDLIASNVSTYQIACDFEYKEGVLFAQTEKEAAELEKIYTASLRAGVEVARTENIPIPLSFRQAIKYRKQAQMHPLDYLSALADRFTQCGGMILENTRVEDVARAAGHHRIQTSAGVMRAQHLVYATHIPPGVNILHFRCAPYRSYVLAVQLTDGQYPDALAYDMQDPYHYFRTHRIDGTPYLIVGGADHKTGHGDPQGSFRELEAYVRKHVDVSSIDYRWSAQYVEPADGLPYIGRLPGGDEHTYVATGFSGNGILFGSFSGILLTDLILGKENPYEKLFSPSRVKPVAAFSNFIKESADVVYRFVADRIAVEQLGTLAELPPGTGAVVTYQNEQVALYKSRDGALSALNPVCTHAGCIVAWNDAEKSWDCPCHGGRYDVHGNVLTGPPRKDLQVIPITQDDVATKR
ncbi:FAD-dependent oxidoreductase [Parapedobacter sp. DT-150]|uniref:FAD-dependent oxidoreductase n=1 Tax=Parapedobacter sp. DT-150 TaxID=3396162 RepID=UPI003F1B1B5B